MMVFTPMIRLCYLTQLAFGQGNYPGVSDLLIKAVLSPAGDRRGNERDFKHERNPMSGRISSAEVEQATRQGSERAPKS